MVALLNILLVPILASYVSASAIGRLSPRVGADNPNYEADARAQNEQRKICHMWRQNILLPDGKTGQTPFKHGDNIAECKQQCPANTKSVACALTTTPVWLKDPSAGKGVVYTLAPCLCDDKTISALTNAFIEGLPALGQVICTVWVGALTGIVDALINTALDTAEKAIQAVQAMGTITPAHDKLIQGALQFKNAHADVSQARSAFGKWVASKVCDIGALSKDQSDQIFDAVSQVNNIAISAATLPVGGGILSGFRLASLPEMASNGAHLLSQLPVNWVDPPARPKNAIGAGKNVQHTTVARSKTKRAEGTVSPTSTTLAQPGIVSTQGPPEAALAYYRRLND